MARWALADEIPQLFPKESYSSEKSHSSSIATSRGRKHLRIFTVKISPYLIFCRCYGLDKCSPKAHVLKAQYPDHGAIKRWWRHQRWDPVGGLLVNGGMWDIGNPVPFSSSHTQSWGEQFCYAINFCHEVLPPLRGLKAISSPNHRLKPLELWAKMNLFFISWLSQVFGTVTKSWN